MPEQELPIFREPEFPPQPEDDAERFHFNGRLVTIGGLSAVAMLGVAFEEALRRRHNANKRADTDGDSA